MLDKHTHKPLGLGNSCISIVFSSVTLYWFTSCLPIVLYESTGGQQGSSWGLPELLAVASRDQWGLASASAHTSLLLTSRVSDTLCSSPQICSPHVAGGLLSLARSQFRCCLLLGLYCIPSFTFIIVFITVWNCIYFLFVSSTLMSTPWEQIPVYLVSHLTPASGTVPGPW